MSLGALKYRVKMYENFKIIVNVQFQHTTHASIATRTISETIVTFPPNVQCSLYLKIAICRFYNHLNNMILSFLPYDGGSELQVC